MTTYRYNNPKKYDFANLKPGRLEKLIRRMGYRYYDEWGYTSISNWGDIKVTNVYYTPKWDVVHGKKKYELPDEEAMLNFLLKHAPNKDRFTKVEN